MSVTTSKKRLKSSGVPWKPEPYMRKGVKFGLERAAAAFLLDPGLGKTSITLAVLKTLFKEQTNKGALVVAPLRTATSTWPAEVAKWSDFQNMSLVVLHGDKKEAAVREKHDIYVINYEGLAWLFTRRKVGKVWKYEMTEAGKALLKNVDVLVLDELSKMKHSDTLRFKLLKPWLKKFSRRYGLTGSPASNGLLDLFGQMYVLDDGRSLGPYVTYYRSQYFTQVDPRGFRWALQPGAEEAIYERIRPLALRMEATDYVTLPTVMNHTLKFDLPIGIRKQYEQLEEEFLTTLEDSTVVTALNSGVASGKCRQFCSGALYTSNRHPVTGELISDAKREWKELHREKLAVLADLVEELNGQQMLVGYDFGHDKERLQKLFPDAAFIGGGTSTKIALDAEKRWNSGELQLLFGHPAAMAHGLNLQGSSARNVCWFTLTWDFELYDQFVRRVLRRGNTAQRVNVYHIVARNTVEESVLFALRRKDKVQKSLLDALKSKKRVDN